MKRNRLSLVEMIAALVVFCIIFIAATRMLEVFRGSSRSLRHETDAQASMLMNIFSLALADTSYSSDYKLGSSFFVIDRPSETDRKEDGRCDAVAFYTGANFGWMKTKWRPFKFMELAALDIETQQEDVTPLKKKNLVLGYFSDDPSTNPDSRGLEDFPFYLPPYGEEIKNAGDLFDKINERLYDELDKSIKDDQPYNIRLADNVIDFKVIPVKYDDDGRTRREIRIEDGVLWHEGMPDTIEIKLRLMPRSLYEKYIRMPEGNIKNDYAERNSFEYVGTFKPWENE